jgi:ABC-2 type transport system ATP-binding protein
MEDLLTWLGFTKPENGSPAELADGIEASVLVVEAEEPRKIARFMESLPFVHSTAQIGNTLRVMVDREMNNPADDTRQAIEGAGLRMDSCRKVHPSLEDVFVAATQARKASRGQDT